MTPAGIKLTGTSPGPCPGVPLPKPSCPSRLRFRPRLSFLSRGHPGCALHMVSARRCQPSG